MSLERTRRQDKRTEEKKHKDSAVERLISLYSSRALQPIVYFPLRTMRAETERDEAVSTAS